MGGRAEDKLIAGLKEDGVGARFMFSTQRRITITLAKATVKALEVTYDDV